MTDQMKNLLILLCGIAVVLLVVIILFAGKSPFMKLMSYFLEEQDDSESGRHSNNVNTSQKSRKNQDCIAGSMWNMTRRSLFRKLPPISRK